MTVTGWFWRPWDQQRAIKNAHEASTILGRRRAEHEEVELFMRTYSQRGGKQASA